MILTGSSVPPLQVGPVRTFIASTCSVDKATAALHKDAGEEETSL